MIRISNPTLRKYHKNSALIMEVSEANAIPSSKRNIEKVLIGNERYLSHIYLLTKNFPKRMRELASDYSYSASQREKFSGGFTSWVPDYVQLLRSVYIRVFDRILLYKSFFPVLFC